MHSVHIYHNNFSDVAGHISPLGIGGAKYILVAVDVYPRFLHAMPMRRKSQAASLLAPFFCTHPGTSYSEAQQRCT